MKNYPIKTKKEFEEEKNELFLQIQMGELDIGH